MLESPLRVRRPKLRWPSWADAEYRHWLLHTLLKRALITLLYILIILLAING